jgi:hypothetical protein
VRNILIAVTIKKRKTAPLSQTHPVIAKEADGWEPADFFAGSTKKMLWKCLRGHNFETRISHRTTGKSVCPVCSNHKLLVGFNDLQTTHPEIAKEANGWDPSTLIAGTHQKKSWRCKKQHTYVAQVVSRTGPEKTSCPFCANYKVLPGFNDLNTTHPDLALEADGWSPTTVLSGTNQKKKWICPLGHRYSALVSSRTRELGSGCPVCANRVIEIGFNDLATTHPALSLQAEGWDPHLIVGGSNLIRKWKCSEGHIWRAKVANRAILNRGCPTCAKSGFDPNTDGYLYFLQHPHWDMYQIGITNFPDDRLSDHEKLAWELLELRGPMDGHLTQQWETAILRMLKARGADLSNSKIAGKFDGYSEAWSKSTFEVKSIKELMRLTEEFEEEKNGK